MAQPYSKTLDSEWTKAQDFTDVVWGDAIFEASLVGAKKLEEAWKDLASSWPKVLGKAVQTGFFGWGKPLVSLPWLHFKFFGHKKHWPQGLTPKELQILELSRRATHYHPTFAENLKRNTPDPTPEPESATLEAFQSLASKFEDHLTFPMWKAYDRISDDMAPLVREACKKVYKEPCSLKESRGMFQGDLSRAWKAETLKVSTVTYKVYGEFIDYIRLVSSTR